MGEAARGPSVLLFGHKADRTHHPRLITTQSIASNDKHVSSLVPRQMMFRIQKEEEPNTYINLNYPYPPYFFRELGGQTP